MTDYKLEPKQTLTEEVINELNIHSTLSSLRRAGAVSPCIKKVDNIEEMPTIYYIKGDVNPEVQDWTLHALNSDLTRYLLAQTCEQDSESDDQENPDQEEVLNTLKGRIDILNFEHYNSTNEFTRLDILNDNLSLIQDTELEVKITMQDDTLTYTGKYFINGEESDLTVNANELTCLIPILEVTPGTTIQFEVSCEGYETSTYVINLGSELN